MNPIEQHYNTIDEHERLNRFTGQLEGERTRIIISKHLPAEPATILDAGGGTGVYSFWLASLGHKVSLLDFTAKHISKAKARQEQSSHKLQGIAQGDARDLGSYETGTFDIVLFFGPLYHLVEKKDRNKALNEAFRVLKKGGKLIAAGIQKYASLYDGIHRGLIDDPYFVEILKQDLKDGQHRNPKNVDEYFTTAYFQLPSEMKEEIGQCGFNVIETVSVEGPAWIAQDFETRWKDEVKRKQLLEILQLIEHDENLLNITQHYLVVAKK
ncbi:MAG TPA: class I SAM-dependent methyltransferase [Chitinophagaceae bacterium]